MSPLSIAVGFWIILVLVVEGGMWQLFKSKFRQISIESDKTFFHFFTLGRMRVFATLHTVFLIVVILLSHFFFWQ